MELVLFSENFKNMSNDDLNLVNGGDFWGAVLWGAAAVVTSAATVAAGALTVAAAVTPEPAVTKAVVGTLAGTTVASGGLAASSWDNFLNELK